MKGSKPLQKAQLNFGLPQGLPIKINNILISALMLKLTASMFKSSSIDFKFSYLSEKVLDYNIEK